MVGSHGTRTGCVEDCNYTKGGGTVGDSGGGMDGIGVDRYTEGDDVVARSGPWRIAGCPHERWRGSHRCQVE